MRYADVKSAMDSYFLNTDTGKLNVGYLVDNLELWIDNTEKFRAQIWHGKAKVQSIIWQGFCDFAIDICYGIHYPKLGIMRANYVPRSEQLKKYLAQYGYGYEIFSELIEKYEQERKNYPNL